MIFLIWQLQFKITPVELNIRLRSSKNKKGKAIRYLINALPTQERNYEFEKKHSLNLWSKSQKYECGGGLFLLSSRRSNFSHGSEAHSRQTLM